MFAHHASYQELCGGAEDENEAGSSNYEGKGLEILKELVKNVMENITRTDGENHAENYEKNELTEVINEYTPSPISDYRMDDEVTEDPAIFVNDSDVFNGNAEDLSVPGVTEMIEGNHNKGSVVTAAANEDIVSEVPDNEIKAAASHKNQIVESKLKNVKRKKRAAPKLWNGRLRNVPGAASKLWNGRLRNVPGRLSKY